jgi:hypothetical protein
MNEKLENYKNDITAVFTLGVEVLNVSRSLKSISLDLKLLAINGIVQAARIGNHQGQSLITLSGFLSDLPVQIAPELRDLEDLSNRLSKEITIISITVRRFMLYSMSLYSFSKELMASANKNLKDVDINLMNAKELLEIERNPLFRYTSKLEKNNLRIIAQKNLSIIRSLNKLLSASEITINSSRTKIERIRRNGFIANYMGSNILIESAYLRGTNQNFNDLVSNIHNIVNNLNEKLDSILEKIDESSRLLKNLINNGIIK